MKKLPLCLLLVVGFATVNAKVSVLKVPVQKDAASAVSGFIKPPALGDVGSTTKGITDLLGSKLSLADAQKPKLTDAISGFLTQKKGITGATAFTKFLE